MKRWGQLAIAAAAVGYGVDTALSVVTLKALRPADLLTIELGGSTVILLAVTAASGKLHRQNAGRAMAQGAVLPGLSFLLGNLGLARTTATSGALLLSVDTVATVLLAALVLHERIGALAGTAAVLGTVGIALVAVYGPDAEATVAVGSQTVGNLLVIASVVGSAGYVVWSRRAAQPTEEGGDDSIGRTAWQFLGAALAVLPFVVGSWWTGGSRIGSADSHTLLLAGAVLLCGLGALLAFNIGIDAVSASRAGLIFTVQPLAGAVTAIAVFGEPFVTGQAVGGALILVGLLLLTRDRPDGRSPAEPPAVPAATTTK